ncbi:hypothetical protein OSTOST_22357, partial [Ostertagia ostertagi]
VTAKRVDFYYGFHKWYSSESDIDLKLNKLRTHVQLGCTSGLVGYSRVAQFCSDCPLPSCPSVDSPLRYYLRTSACSRQARLNDLHSRTKQMDIMIGVKSTALRLGDNTKPWLCGFGTAAIAGLGLTGYIAEQTWPYYLALAGHSSFNLAMANWYFNIHPRVKDC